MKRKQIIIIYFTFLVLSAIKQHELTAQSQDRKKTSFIIPLEKTCQVDAAEKVGPSLFADCDDIDKKKRKTAVSKKKNWKKDLCSLVIVAFIIVLVVWILGYLRKKRKSEKKKAENKKSEKNKIEDKKTEKKS